MQQAGDMESSAGDGCAAPGGLLPPVSSLLLPPALAPTFPAPSRSVRCGACGETVPRQRLAAHVSREVEKLQQDTRDGVCGEGRLRRREARRRAERKAGGQQALDRLRRRRSKRSSRGSGSSSRARVRETGEEGEEVPTCFQCGESLYGGLEAINMHVDHCLGLQERVRAVELLDATWADLGVQTLAEGADEEVNIDDDDEEQFGAAQFTPADVANAHAGSAGGGAAVVTRGGQAGGANGKQGMEEVGVEEVGVEEVVTQAGSGGQLLASALEAKLQAQARLLANVPRCLICLEVYCEPLVSICCWHVHCRQCWLDTLASKRLCPQCQVITAASDLRRIFL